LKAANRHIKALEIEVDVLEKRTSEQRRIHTRELEMVEDRLRREVKMAEKRGRDEVLSRMGYREEEKVTERGGAGPKKPRDGDYAESVPMANSTTLPISNKLSSRAGGTGESALRLAPRPPSRRTPF
jgi:hypothetical protein